MKCLRTANLKRCRPLLGTYVIVTVKGANERLAGLAAERAFQAVKKVQRLMSAHDSQSDLGRIFHQSPFEPLQVDPWTYQVLTLGRKLSLLSSGLFDVTVGAGLERMGFLPPLGGGPKRISRATYADLDLLPGDRVMTRRPCRLDLGGIAKGFAVDKAVEAAFAGPGVRAVTLNAGGDIRIQANRPQELWLRDPFHPKFFWKGGLIKEGSFASSGGVDAVRDSKHGPATPLIKKDQPLPPPRTPGVLVAASTCMVADALTKIVSLAPPELAAKVVTSLGARAWIAFDERGFQELSNPASSSPGYRP